MYNNTHTSPRGASRPRAFQKPSFKSGGSFSPRRSSVGGSFANRGGSRGGSMRGNGKGKGKYINPELFIQKAVVTTEVVQQFVPEHKFADFAIDSRLKQNIVNKGYVLPTPIQDKSIPHVLRGDDVLGIANTGTGKTAAFLIPLIHKVLDGYEQKRKEQVLIVVPTRELAIQIQTELRGFTTGLKLFSVCTVGGSPIGPQMRDLRYHNEFVIGTPGRIKDLIERNALNLSTFNTVVLDEADRMLDMGFINDMRLLMTKMPKPRHTLFFSATLSNEIKALVGEFLHNPVTISVKTQDTSKNVDQDIVRVPRDGNKMDVLHDLLNAEDFQKVLIFGRTKHGVEKLSQMLSERGFKSESIHGDKNNSARQRALAAFKDSRVQILVATDVAARGLDIPAVSHVINFDVPGTYEDYVHRIGRTGRAGKKGKALTFID